MPTRRFLLCFVACAALAARGLLAQTNLPAAHAQGAPADQMRTSLHQEVVLSASPGRIYEILLSSKEFSAFTGLPAEISSEGGGTFSMFGGRILGRNIELVPNQRIVQAWREANWDPGVYSLVKFELKEQGSKTKVILDHTGFGEGHFGHLNPGWKARYWDPLEKYLAASANR